MKRSLGFALLAACSGPAANGVGNTGGPVGPVGPPPTIAFTDGGGFTTTGLPAIAADGSRVVIGMEDSDGGRGAPNLTLLVKDRDDGTVDTKPIWTIAQVDQGGEETGPDVAAVQAGNQFLAESNQHLAWTPMVGTDARPVGEDAEGGSLAMSAAQEVDAPTGGIVLHFDGSGHLVITRGSATLFDKVEDGWLTKDYLPYPGAGADETCSNPAYLARAYVDLAHTLALVDIGYYGTDSCWEPSDELHVVTW